MKSEFCRLDTPQMLMEKDMNRKQLSLAAILILAGLLTTGAALAQAQRADPSRSPDRPWHHEPRGAEQQLAHLDHALDLTDEQSLQLLEVLQLAEAEREALHARAMESFQPEICALRQNTEADIFAILTPEQAETLRLLQQERAGRREHRHGFMPDCPDEDG
jgi:Spy/CpxP family protein refolding chaperone